MAANTPKSIQGNLQMYKKRAKKWKTYFFKVTASTYLHYFADQTLSKPKGEQILMSVMSVSVPPSPPKGGQYVFEVKFKSTLWQLSASTDEERQQWMDTINPHYGTDGRARTASTRPNIKQSKLPEYYANKQQVESHLHQHGSTRYVVPETAYESSRSSTSDHDLKVNSLPASFKAADTQQYSDKSQYTVSPLRTDNYIDTAGYEIMDYPTTSSFPHSSAINRTHEATSQCSSAQVGTVNTAFSEMKLSTDTNAVTLPQAKAVNQDQQLLKHYRIPFSALTNPVFIGKGNFGEVFKADYLPVNGRNSIEVAVKTFSSDHSVEAKQEMLQEFVVMATMVHPNIVRLFGIAMEDVINPRIIIEYLPHGDLKTYLKRSSQKPVSTLVKYMIDVAMGMHYMAEKGLIHRDLAARNVLVGEGELCKVSDFGLIRELPSDMSIYLSQTQVPLPIRWMPPEAVSDRTFSEASDVWSFGILQWEMFNPTILPYSGMDNSQVVMHIISGKRLPPPERCPSVISTIMQTCWHVQPNQRPQFLDITHLLQQHQLYIR